MRLQVQVRPGAKRTVVTGWSEDLLKVSVAAPPIDGRANEALIEFLAAELGLPRRQIQVVRGVASRLKLVEIDASPEIVRKWLKEIPRPPMNSPPSQP